MLHDLQKELQQMANPEKAKTLQGFFKTGKGQYGEGDIFLGITVPESRRIAEKYSNISFSDIEELLKSPVHEHRLIALLSLVHKYETSDAAERKKIVYFYLDNTEKVNNWDLVDLSAPKILGHFLLETEKDRKILYDLAASANLWEKRIAIVSTFSFIRKNQFDDTFVICELLLKDKHDLMHKACGWMLREVGKKNSAALESFLKKHYKIMPRTMLRYAIERFPESKRKKYLEGKI
jgi:3-methyladenine DNA glycosylase AlkD